MQNLVIVESPTKSRTLQKFLGSKYQVEASMGHIRDLPKSEIGINIEANFEPKYIIPRDKLKRVNELKKLAKEAQVLWLATDPDREGEAIAWHLSQILKLDIRSGKMDKEIRSLKLDNLSSNLQPHHPASNIQHLTSSKQHPTSIHRVVFHEITPEAIKEAFESPRDLNLNLVDAQQARRVLDRLVGYKLSPLLWKKIKSGLSAGRVQSVALRLIVEKEKEVQAFKPVEYWSIEAELELRIKNQELRGKKFSALLIEKDGKKLEIKNQQKAEEHLKNLKQADYKIAKVIIKEVKRYPSPAFTTSTLQQTANLKLSLTSKKTMMLAQGLYERGLITYMRTDSVNLSEFAIKQIRDYINQSLGQAYLPPKPRFFTNKSKLAQEAHEAIRPTNINVKSEELKNKPDLTRDHLRLYDLIWKRSLACQMSEAVLDQTSVDVEGSYQSSDISHQISDSLKVFDPEVSDRRADSEASLKTESYLLRSTGSVIKFEGWLKLYQVQNSKLKVQSDEDKENQDENKEQILPPLTEGEILKLLKLLPEQHFTESPPRFNEASLIKKLEELGIGRPSTYAPILSTIQERYYVEKKEKKFFPTELGITVANFLIDHFPEVFDYSFTAQMENELDEVAEGERKWKEIMKEFYTPFEKKLVETEETSERVKIVAEVTDKVCPECGKQLVIKFGKFGKFLACSGFPDCKHTESLEVSVDVKCPDCGGEILMRKTRKGRPFYGCKNWPACKYASWTKPKTS